MSAHSLFSNHRNMGGGNTNIINSANGFIHNLDMQQAIEEKVSDFGEPVNSSGVSRRTSTRLLMRNLQQHQNINNSRSNSPMNDEKDAMKMD